MMSSSQRSRDRLLPSSRQLFAPIGTRRPVFYSTPILLHSKTMSIDDDMAVIGSSNLDMRSFHLNLEVTLICYASQVVADLQQIEANYIRKSKQVNLGEWKTRSAGKIFFENISRLT